MEIAGFLVLFVPTVAFQKRAVFKVGFGGVEPAINQRGKADVAGSGLDGVAAAIADVRNLGGVGGAMQFPVAHDCAPRFNQLTSRRQSPSTSSMTISDQWSE